MGFIGQTLCQLEKTLLNQPLAAEASLKGTKTPKNRPKIA
jgi:hypothetical protein